ncbi:MAG: hypothetical protein JW757_06545 [Anaerolineales bacterium]|nr:hypothetical protein [Anaerolineales bacterium]
MTEQPSFCYRHPDRETSLRCNRCDKPICPQCAQRTATGYRCPDCIKEQSKVFVTARWYDYITSFLTSMILSLIGYWLMGLISGIGFFFFFFVFVIAAAIGGGIAEAVRWVIRKRRAKSLFRTAAAGVIVGGLLVLIPELMFVILYGDFSYLFSLIWPTLYFFLVASSTYVRLSGIQLSR